MFETYWPERFCRDYVELKQSSGQLVNFMATVLGHKPLMDDWVASSRLADFTALCARYGLHVRAESLFLGIAKERVPAQVVGRAGITSTSGLGLPLESGVEGGVHVFISRDPALLSHGMWYPVIVRNRVIWPPRMDLLRYGDLLGYPPCCVRFFQQFNDWRRYSFLYEIFRRSDQLHPLCNPLGKDRTYSYIYHMPCTFDCAATVERVTRLRADIAAREPGLVRAIDYHLTLPALVLRERKLYFLEGEARGDKPMEAPSVPVPRPEADVEVAYARHFYEGSDSEGNVCAAALSASHAVTVRGADIVFHRHDGGTEVHTCDSSGFAPEIPFLALFGGAANEASTGSRR